MWIRRPRLDNAGMGQTDEDGDETATVIDRLAARFPTLDREHVTQVVHEEHERLNGARVRDFIPVLVEHEATERLRLEAPPQMSPIGDAGGAALAEPEGMDPLEFERRSHPPGGPLLGNSGGN